MMGIKGYQKIATYICMMLSAKAIAVSFLDEIRINNIKYNLKDKNQSEETFRQSNIFPTNNICF